MQMFGLSNCEDSHLFSGQEEDICSISVLKIESMMAARGYSIGRDR